MNSNPPVGAIAYGHSGIACTVIHVEADRIVMICPDGKKRVPSSAIARWELPESYPDIGDRVRLKNTPHEYTLIEVFEHRSLFGDDRVETWARLCTDCGRSAYWKLEQLERVQTQ